MRPKIRLLSLQILIQMNTSPVTYIHACMTLQLKVKYFVSTNLLNYRSIHAVYMYQICARLKLIHFSIIH